MAERTNGPGRRAAALVLVAVTVASSCSGGDGTTNAGGSATAAPTSAASLASATTTAAPVRTAPAPRLVLDSGEISEAALAGLITADGRVDDAVLRAVGVEFDAMRIEQQRAIAAELSLRAESSLAALSGLEAEIGGRGATRRALQAAGETAGAFAPAAALSATPGRSAVVAARRAPEPTPGAAVGGVLFGSLVAGTSTTVSLVDASNALAPGARESTVDGGRGLSASSSVGEVRYEGRSAFSKDGVDVEFVVGAVVHPCPDPDGSFTIEAVVDVTARKGTASQSVRMELKVVGRVGDDAELVDREVQIRSQWADAANRSGRFVDVTLLVGSVGASTTVNRSAGTVSDAFVAEVLVASTLVGGLSAEFVLDATEQAWKSGRCVALTVTPSAGPTGLDPSQVVTVVARPRSKVDGQGTGGSVTATLSGGETSIDPDASPVPADATHTYTAPDALDETGAVAYESRSRRGIGKVIVTFATATPTYRVSGRFGDESFDAVVCDVAKGFILQGRVMTMTFTATGAAGGTVEVAGSTGGAAFEGSGTYTLDLPGGLRQDGTMAAQVAQTVKLPTGQQLSNRITVPFTLTATTDPSC